jgi:hypothetical protein
MTTRALVCCKAERTSSREERLPWMYLTLSTRLNLVLTSKTATFDALPSLISCSTIEWPRQPQPPMTSTGSKDNNSMVVSLWTVFVELKGWRKSER